MVKILHRADNTERIRNVQIPYTLRKNMGTGEKRQKAKRREGI
jgi:hypothetical protein